MNAESHDSDRKARSAAGSQPTTDRVRRGEILNMAAEVFASSSYVSSSLRDIADRCGMLPGSLYYYFESKEAIAIELMEIFEAELDAIGRSTLQAMDDAPARSIDQQILDLSLAIASCGTRNRAALQLSLFEPWAAASERLIELVGHRSQPLDEAMTEILRRGRTSGYLRPEIDLGLLADELRESMQHVSLGIFHPSRNSRDVATTLCRLLLDGVATTPPDEDALDRSAAMAVANETVESWSQPDDAHLDETARRVYEIARTKFARRGYDATTIRDIASAADIRSSKLYRIIESKESLLESIMGSFHARLSGGYAAVAATKSSTVEKIDALAWLNINMLVLFPEEFMIQRTWMRAIQPYTTNFAASYAERERIIRSVVSKGLRSGEIRAGTMGPKLPPLNVLTSCFRDLMWPEHAVTQSVVPVDPWATLRQRRNTLFLGAAESDGVVLTG